MSTNPMMAVDRLRELADFLRTRRARIAPKVAGLPSGTRRRTPGLRREELAQLAGLSVDWYTRLEQGRDVTPSRETLEAIAGVLRLDEVERGHLFYLARPEQPPHHRDVAEPALLAAMNAMNVPAVVLSPRFDVLAHNAAMLRLLPAYSGREANLLRLAFLDAATRAAYMDIASIERETVASFRMSAGQFIGHPDFEILVRELLAASPRFAELWAAHEVAPKVGGTKRFKTRLGEVAVDWHALTSATGSRQMLALYVARAGTEDARRMAELLA